MDQGKRIKISLKENKSRSDDVKKYWKQQKISIKNLLKTLDYLQKIYKKDTFLLI